MNPPRLLAVPTFSLTQLTYKNCQLTLEESSRSRHLRVCIKLELLMSVYFVTFAYTCCFLLPAILHEHACS